MPYNPQVQDISGQLLAQGMMQRAQSISGLVGDFMKMEDERQKTTGALKGFLSDPYYQQQVNTNPELAGFAQKVQKGSASLGDVRQFLGTMTAMQSAREQQQKADQMEAQRQYNDALKQQALANKSAIDAATAERTRQNEISNQLDKTVKEFYDLEKMEKEGAILTSEQSDKLESMRDNKLLSSVIQADKAGLGGNRIEALRLFMNQDALDQKAQNQELLARLREMEIENRRVKAETEAANRPRLVAGSTKNFKIDGKDIVGVWTGNEYVDEESGAPLYPTIEFTDRNLNKVSRRGSLNPEIARRLGIKTTVESMAMPGMPGVPGISGDQLNPDNMEEVIAPGTKTGPKNFTNEAQARQALERGEIMPGQKILIGGRRVTVQAKTQ